jgi:hypothetical protein
MKFTSLLILLFFVNFQLEIVAQGTVSGIISDYSDGKGLIISYDIVTGDTYTWGKIDDQGLITIPLSATYLDEIKKMAAKAQKKAPNGFTLKLPNVEDTFTCRYPDVKFENPGCLVSGLPDLILTGKRKKANYGSLYAVNSRVIANWLHQGQQGNIELGYYLMFYFAEEKASAKGTCMTTNYTGSGEENFDEFIIFDLDLEKGWNIVKYEIEEVLESINGVVFPEVIKITKLENLPDDLEWVRVLGS